MLHREYKFIKYVKRHNGISRDLLIEKFADLDELHFRVGVYIDRRDITAEEEQLEEERLLLQAYEQRMSISETAKYVKGNITSNGIKDKKIYYYITYEGTVFLERKRKEFLNFIVPYTITTIIAASSIIMQIIQLLLAN